MAADKQPFYFGYYRIAIILSIPLVSVPLAYIATELLTPIVEFILLVFSSRIWNSVYGWFNPPYLYIVLNLVIVTLGLKSGALNNIDDPANNYVISNIVTLQMATNSDHAIRPAILRETLSGIEPPPDHGMAVGVAYNLEVGNEDNAEQDEEGGGLSAEELYVKAEAFIGSFYRQLGLQRVDSWNRLDGFYPESG